MKEWGDLRLRPAARADLARLLEIEVEAQPSPWSETVFEKEFDLDHSHVWVLETETVLGFVVFWVVVDEMHILNVAVASSERRKGYARKLIESVIEKAHADACVAITLEVRVGNAAAIGLYESFEFRVIGHRPRYYRDNGEDAAVMARVLEEGSAEDG